MLRHFLTLYLLIVTTLAAVSWGQEQLLRAYERQHELEPTEDAHVDALFEVISAQLRSVSIGERETEVTKIAARSSVDLELFQLQDIAGDETLARLAAGQRALLRDADGRTWSMRRLDDSNQVLAFKYVPVRESRNALEWGLVLSFYAAIALVIMLWLWPLARDLRDLERSTMTFGDRNWRFDTRVGPRSQVYPLAEAFRRMAGRIDRLIASHKDMSNAMSHEIKTPLARMRFEIEMARMAQTPQKIAEHLDNLDRDVDQLNAFVTATLDYAFLERAELALNLAHHDFTHILPAIAASVQHNALSATTIECDVDPKARAVKCDIHLLETVVRNLLHNALRYAHARVRLQFLVEGTTYVLRVEDDGPGIAPADRERVFESFVQLDSGGQSKSGFGLGLAIVKRVLEWHGGTVSVSASDWGGARFEARWSG